MRDANVVEPIRKRVMLFFAKALKGLTALLSLTIPLSHIGNKLSNTSFLKHTKYTGLPFSPYVDMKPFLQKIDMPRRYYNMNAITNAPNLTYWDFATPRYTLCLQPMRTFSKKYKLEQDQYIVVTRPAFPYSIYVVRYAYPAKLHVDYKLIFEWGRCVDVYVRESNNTLLNFLCVTNASWSNKEMTVTLTEIHYSYVVVLINYTREETMLN
jgi:hypothetical protein